jgi:hypothetical protein
MIPNLCYVLMESKQFMGKPICATRMGEKMIQGGRPIVEYRRRREALMVAASGDDNT